MNKFTKLNGKVYPVLVTQKKINNNSVNNNSNSNINININDDKIKIIIYTPELDMNCGGIVVLHYLAKLINDLKYKNIIAKLYYINNHLHHINKISHHINKTSHHINKTSHHINKTSHHNIFCNDFYNNDQLDDNTIVIYPEIIGGNPLNAKYVIRWILGELGMCSQQNIFESWDKNDIVFHWEPINKQNYKTFNCPYLNPIFVKTNFNKRENTCYLIKKGRTMHKNINYFHPQNSICIDNMKIENIVECFNSCKYFYCYDPFTFFVSYAIICGCIPIVYPLENKTKEEYINNTLIKNIKNFAMAYGNSETEINYAENILNESALELLNINNSNLENTRIFLDEILNYKNNINLDKFGTVYNNYYI